jgi:uncharacterized protein YerC
MTSGKVVSAGANPETATRFDDLVEAFTRLRDPSTVAAFLRDLCTSTELDTGASTATVTRVAQWLHHGEGGYQAALKRGRK